MQKPGPGTRWHKAPAANSARDLPRTNDRCLLAVSGFLRMPLFLCCQKGSRKENRLAQFGVSPQTPVLVALKGKPKGKPFGPFWGVRSLKDIPYECFSRDSDTHTHTQTAHLTARPQPLPSPLFSQGKPPKGNLEVSQDGGPLFTIV